MDTSRPLSVSTVVRFTDGPGRCRVSGPLRLLCCPALGWSQGQERAPSTLVNIRVHNRAFRYGFKKRGPIMAKQTLDELILTADDVLWGRVDQARSRIETRIERAQGEGRDFTDRERQLSEADRDELVLLRDAVEIRSARREQGDEIERTQRETEQRQGQIAQAMRCGA